ncbi:uncharacterized protein LOC109422985 [Aedes albopictus]|uniref:Retrotransposon gag domain-containing protein n=1 Tax=Aedes albopictus TaxID=7160 RepID=A0ABM1YWJ3_AEDAL
MDLEFEVQYKQLMVHHLERHEIEYELAIRAVQFEPSESRSAIQRRLRDRLKEEKGLNTLDVDFLRFDKTVDAEIKTIDANVEQIREYLENEVRFEGFKDSLKTRLVHYFARVRRAQEYAEADEDLTDFDKLLCSIRGLMNTHFSIFSPIQSVREEVMQEIVRSVSNLKLGAVPKNNKSKKGEKADQSHSKSPEGQGLDLSASEREDRELGAVARQESSRRVLKSYRKSGREVGSMSEVLASLYPFVQPPHAYGGPRKDVSQDSNQSERVIRKFSLSHRSKSRPSPAAETSDSVVESDPPSSASSSEPPVERHRANRHRRRAPPKSRPVSEWNIKYDGRDQGQTLMKFIKEVDFYAKSENVSKRELFRSAIHLFKDQAKSWFMSGVENEDFANWDELVAELKREFLSPDHDHVNEIKAISRKQGPKERFSDYLSELQKIFNSLTKPISEKKKFEIVYRNLRSDYKGHAVASNIDNLADLKRFGRQLDSTYWYKYTPNNQDQVASRNKAQVNEVRESRYQPKPPGEDQKKSFKSRSFYRSRKEGSGEEDQPMKKSSRENPRNLTSEAKNPEEPRLSRAWVDRYVPPEEGTCFNCRRQGHDHTQCTYYRNKFCLRCGLHQVETKNCPYCAKNFK